VTLDAFRMLLQRTHVSLGPVVGGGGVPAGSGTGRLSWPTLPLQHSQAQQQPATVATKSAAAWQPGCSDAGVVVVDAGAAGGDADSSGRARPPSSVQYWARAGSGVVEKPLSDSDVEEVFLACATRCVRAKRQWNGRY
jgi:hypothetical protein